MNIDRDVQSFGGLEDRPEFLIIKIFAARMRIELELGHRTFEFLRGRLRRLRRNGCERGKAVRMRVHRFAHLIVACCCQRDRNFGIEQLHSRGGEEEDLHVYASGIHVADAAFADVQHAFAHGNAAFAHSEPVMPPQTVEAGIVCRTLFEQFLIEGEEFSAYPSFFGRNAPVRPAPATAFRHKTLPCYRQQSYRVGITNIARSGHRRPLRRPALHPAVA